MTQFKDTMQKSHPNTRARCEIRSALMATVTRCAMIEAQWKMLRRRGLSTLPLPKTVKLALVLLARRAEHNCGRLADRAISGLASLDAGDCRAAERALASCLAMIAMDRAADRAAARLLRNSKPGMGHGCR